MSTDFAALLKRDDDPQARKLIIVDRTTLGPWLEAQGAAQVAHIQAARFEGAADTLLVLPPTEGWPSEGGWSAVAGVADAAALGPWCLAKAADLLPGGSYRVTGADGAPASAGAAALGWMLAQHRFDRYRPKTVARDPRVLLMPDLPPEPLVAEARAVALVRDLVDTPALDMGPADLEAEAMRLSTAFGAVPTVTAGEALVRDFPMIQAVGMAATPDRAPRLIELRWGALAHPRLTVVGKGVCFDTGGLDIKPSSGMRNMKKDMGGAAHALALAELVMATRLPVRLHLLIPAVENAIAGAALRPGDVLTSRAGLSVEIANTDAEGRLVLADALTLACEGEQPDLLIDFATLTGAARVALGPDLPAMFANDDTVAAALLAAGRESVDPVWRLPLHDGYDDMLKSDVADLNNAPEGGFAGAITAALFLRRFVAPAVPWMHLDTFAWRPSALPGRPKGGDALGLRAVWQMLRARYVANVDPDDGRLK